MTLIVSKHGTTTRISREPFENEQALQHYILLNPEAIPLEDVAPGTRLFVLGAIPRIFGAETRRASGTRSRSANIDPQTAMSAWQEQHGADAASCWQSFLSAVHAANIPRLEVGHYPSGLPYLYLTQTRIGNVSVIRLSKKKAQLRDELHTNSNRPNANRFAGDPVANLARANFRTMLLAKVPAAIDAASNGRVYVPVSALPDASSDIIAGLRRLASELET